MEEKSCINPMGQIHPQKTLPKKTVAMNIIRAGMWDNNGTRVPVRITLRLIMGSSLHRSLMGDEELEML
jgi:hypothetical protein